MKRIAVVAVLLALAASFASAEEPAKDPIFKFYGFVKFEAAYATAAMDSYNLPSAVATNAIRDKNDNLSMTARYSRLGLDIKMPEFEKVKVAGKFEMDFVAGDASKPSGETSGYMRMRLANIDVAFDGGFSIKAGQCWDVVSPLAPTTLNSQAGGAQGSPGTRHPQIIFAQKLPFGLDIQAGAIRINGNESSALPAAEARVAYTLNYLGTKTNPFTVGVSGVYGKLANKEDSYLFGADIVAPILPMLRFKGEAFMAKNAGTYSATIGQDVGKGYGGFAQLECEPVSWLSFWVGGLLEKLEADSIAAKAKQDNMYLMFGTGFQLTPALKLGLEVAYLETKYKDLGVANGYRGQFVMQFNF